MVNWIFRCGRTHKARDPKNILLSVVWKIMQIFIYFVCMFTFLRVWLHVWVVDVVGRTTVFILIAVCFWGQGLSLVENLLTRLLGWPASSRDLPVSAPPLLKMIKVCISKPSLKTNKQTNLTSSGNRIQVIMPA